MDSFDLTSQLFQGHMNSSEECTKFVHIPNVSVAMAEANVPVIMDRVPDGQESPIKSRSCSSIEDVINAVVTDFLVENTLGPRLPCDGQESAPHSTLNTFETPDPSNANDQVEVQDKEKGLPRTSMKSTMRSSKFHKTISRRIKAFRKEMKAHRCLNTLAVL